MKFRRDFYSRASNLAHEVKEYGYLTFTYEKQKFGFGMARAIPLEKQSENMDCDLKQCNFSTLFIGPVYMKVGDPR